MNKVQLTFYTEDLFADISTYCMAAADAVETNERDAHGTRDVLDDGNREIIQGIIARLMFECMHTLYPFVKRPIQNCYHDSKPNEIEAYVMELEFPYERSETDVQLLKQCVQSYIVYKCLSEWLALTLPDTGQWQTWEQKAQEQKEQIATTLVTPMRPKAVRVRPYFY